MIYLRPNSNGPVDYIKSIEKSGLVVMPQKYLGIYTAKAVGNQGPAGPPGDDKNSWFDTIIASASDEDSPITASPNFKTTFRAPYPLKLDEPGFEGFIRGSLTSEPIGSPLTFRVTMNGVSMTAAPIQIDANSRTSVGSLVTPTYTVTEIPDDAEFRVYVDSVGSVFAGSGLKVALTAIKADLVE